MTITIKPYTDATCFTFTGTWGTTANAAAYSSGNVKSTSTIGDSVSIAWTGHTLLLFMVFETNGADLTVTTGGVTQSVKISTCEQTGGSSGTLACKVPVYIERAIADTSHTTVITSVTTGSNTKFYIDAAIILTGAKVPRTVGNYTAIGDSWALGTGATQASQGYTQKVARRLAKYYSRAIALTVRAVGGTDFTALSGTSALTGIEQIIAAAADTPEFLTLQYGVNGLRSASQSLSPPFWAECLRVALMLIEDIFTTSNMKISVATPGYISAFFTYKKSAYSNDFSDASMYESAAALSRLVISEFSWARMADVFALMGRRNEYVYPNAAPDNGLHPNNCGHGVVSEAHIYAITSS